MNRCIPPHTFTAQKAIDATVAQETEHMNAELFEVQARIKQHLKGLGA